MAVHVPQSVHHLRTSIETPRSTIVKFTDTVTGTIFIAVVATGVFGFSLVSTDLFEDSSAGRDSNLIPIAPLTIPGADHTTVVLLEAKRVLGTRGRGPLRCDVHRRIVRFGDPRGAARAGIRVLRVIHEETSGYLSARCLRDAGRTQRRC